MANLTGITAVRPTVNTRVSVVQYGATIVAGNSLYLDTTDNKYKLADANGLVGTAAAVAIAMTPGADTEYGVVALDGPVILVGTTMAVGEPYAVSATAGAIAPETDLTTDDWVTRMGTAKTTTQLDLGFRATAIQHA